MTTSASSIFAAMTFGLDQSTQSSRQTTDSSSFDSLLFGFLDDTSSNTNSASDILSASSIGGLTGSDPMSMISGLFTANETQGATYPFTPDFQSTFGLSGPLPAWITQITASLHLSAQQNQSLQEIAIKNKDIIKTPDSVAKVAQELTAAGIG